MRERTRTGKGRAMRIAPVWLLALPEAALACERCFGAGGVDTPVTQGIGLAMLSLLAMTAVVMGGIAAFFVNVWKRARRLEPGAMVVTEDGDVRPNQEQV